MNDHVAKPIEPEDLWKALLKWIKPLPQKSSAIVIPKEVPDSDLPSRIEGLDTVDGLRRLLGKKTLYLWMLRKFITGQKSVIVEIQNALEAEDMDTAERLAHTLRGVAGNIGATSLPELAGRLETAIRERHPQQEIDARLNELDKPLAILIAQLDLKLPKERRNTAVTVDLKILKVVCEQLEALLVNDDSAAGNVLDKHADLLNSAFPRHYRQIDESIRSLNFEAALSALRAATDTSTPRVTEVEPL
jgi:HPt (histidine-containing phosphotransfer) domain-containing protein